MRARGTPIHRTISAAEKSEIVTIRAARRAADFESHRRRQPSRAPNHSGCAKKDTS